MQNPSDPAAPPQSYVLDTSYADTFFPELSPAWLSYARAINGVAAPPLDRPFTYLELGAGVGHSTIVNAGAFPAGEFHACDLNPQHVSRGRQYADELGLRNIHFHEASFERLLERGLPRFDFIVLHGVYSWVGTEARSAVRDIIRDRLNTSGLVYLSYNCMPGWASEVPVRRLMVELAASRPGESAAKMQHAVNTLAQWNERGLRYFKENPEAARAVDAYGRVPPNYLAHEFLNDTWQPFYSVDVADDMAGVGLSFLGSATLADNHPMLVIDEAAADAMKGLSSPRQQHLAMDFATNRRFRRDLFIRSDTPRSPTDAVRALSTAIIGSVNDPGGLRGQVKVPRGQITFQADFMDELRGLLGGGAVTLSEAVAALGGKGRNSTEILRNLAFLVAGGALSPFAKAYRYALPAEVRKPANTLVERTLAHIMRERVTRAIPSELLGNGVPVKPLEAIAIVELLTGTEPGPELIAKLRAAAEPDIAESAVQDVARHVAGTLLPNLARLKVVI